MSFSGFNTNMKFFNHEFNITRLIIPEKRLTSRKLTYVFFFVYLFIKNYPFDQVYFL